MTNMHFNPTYEEVVFEQGEQNNKLRSSKSTVQSKFICLGFIFVFAVILVQGIVLYCVLKPSSITKHQLLALDKMINSACKKPTESIQTSSNNSVSLFGITVDTSPLISKIESTLTNYEKGTFGRAIRYRPTDQCLHSGSLPIHDGVPYYKVYPAACDHSSFQQWRKVQHQIQVGKTLNYPKHGSSFEPCLACSYFVKSCDLCVHPCHELNNHPSHNFIIRIYPNQIDLANSRVYFSIHDQLYSTQCLGLQYNEQYNTKVFHLQECTGSDDQSFYLEDADLSVEIEQIRTRQISYLSSMLLGPSGKQQNCPSSS